MFLASGLLLIAIAVEVVATAMLPRAEGFTNPAWTAVVLGGYAVSIWLLTLIVRQLPVSVTYAIWSGLGTAAIAVIGVLYLHESVDAFKIAGISLVIAGVVLLNLHTAT